MGTWSVIWWSALSAAGGVSAAAAALDAVRSARRTRRFCPGPWRRLATALLPHRWVLGNPCRYDMTGLVPGPGGALTCPECGRRTIPSRLIRSPAPVRWLRAVVAVTIVAIGTWCVPVIREGRWVPYTPTNALVAARWAWTGITGRELHSRLERELTLRLYNTARTGWQERRLIEAFAWQMRDETRPRAAARGAWNLAAIGVPGLEYLRATLRSDHYQSRQLAADVLRSQVWERPTDDLLRVTVEGLGRDGIARNEYGWWYLAEHPDAAEPWLADGLGSPDEQRRTLCAQAVVRGGISPLFERAASVIVESLRDNDHPNDAREGAQTLIRMGEASRPAVTAALGSDDGQQREFAEYILRRLDATAAQPSAGSGGAEER